MWHSIFALDVSFWEKVLRSALIYVALVLGLRLAGKRELAQLNVLDFVVLLAVANAVQNGLIGNDNSVTGAVTGMAVLFAVNGLLVLLVFRWPWLKRLILGMATVLVRDGQLDTRALDRERITGDDLLDAVQSAGGDSYADVKLVKIEPGGHFVVRLRKESDEQARYDDLCRKLDELTAAVSRLRPQ